MSHLNYLLVVACFTVPTLAAVWLAGLLPQRGWRALSVTGLAILALSATFDNLIVGAGIVGYDPKAILGIRIPIAPLEDLAYAAIAALLVPAIWMGLQGLGVSKASAKAEFTLGQLLRQLFWASRPISWINTAYPFAAVYLVVGHTLDAGFWVGTLFFLIPYNLLMYGINDVYDYESDLRNPRKGSIEGAVLHPKWHQPTLTVAYLLPVPFLAFLSWNQFHLGQPLTVVWLAIVVFAVVAYSAKGMRFKEIPLLDSVTSATHFVGPMVVAMAATNQPLNSGTALKLIGAFMLWGMASHAFGAVQDIKADREGGLASIATAFGARETVRFALIAYAFAGIALVSGIWPMPLAAIAVIPYLAILWPHRNITDDNCEEANQGWRRFIWLNFFAGFVVTMILVYTVLTSR